MSSVDMCEHDRKNIVVATKSGWLIAATLMRETEKSYIVEYKDTPNKNVVISKDDDRKKIFNNTDEAMDWIEE